MGRVQAGWLLGQVTAKGHGRGMRRQAQSKRGATDTRDAERHGFSALSPRGACLVFHARLALASACLRLSEKREKNSAIYAGLVYG